MSELILSSRTLGQKSGLLSSLLARFEHWLQVAHQRKQLADLDDHLLHDLGISRTQAHLEATKPFWK